ncbi:uncharacterized protein LOC130613056 [Hydractinia symbiolongicarpus]|uniref:uncharacterized protein LOC130613056 n=1 Tax=Hydractinia symbiolongicarpus TaxID=13093 RepID=UPI00254FB79D|nr:uncharacterized protein LOC130613056 [Hydractinia symbiolongicarpus]
MSASHSEYIQKLCRLCGKKIVKSKHYVNFKSCDIYSEVFQSIYGINCEQEDPCVFPKFTCNGCRRKLDEMKTSKKIIGTAASFYPHVDENCVCMNYAVNRKDSLKILELDVSMKKVGFSICDKSDNYKRVYTLCQNEKELNHLLTIRIDNSNGWDFSIYGKPMEKETIQLTKTLPCVLKNDDISTFSSFWKSVSVCTGLQGYEDVIKSRCNFEQPFMNQSGTFPVAFVEDDKMVRFDEDNFKTIRHTNCHFLAEKPSSVCSMCNSFKPTVKKVRSRRKSDDSVLDSSHTNIRYLSREELEERYRNTQGEKQRAIKKVAQLSSWVRKITEKECIHVDDEQHEFIKNIVCNEETCPEIPEGSPQWLLWEQQKEMASKSSPNGMRWHPLIIRWCLSLYHHSPAAYKHLRNPNLNFLKLPHIDTLKKYINFTDPMCGFNPDVIERLIVDSKIATLDDHQKNVSLIYDEMKIKADLVFRQSTGQLVGFTDMGDINDELVEFQKRAEGSSENDRHFASYVIVFMVRGIVSSLVYPFGYFASLGFTSDQLYPCVWEATYVLEAIGFYVRAFISDGASPNRKFYKIMVTPDIGNTYWTNNLLSLDRKIFFISDVPHLIKTTRNCFENSHGNNNTRNLFLDHMDISWNHLVNVYEWDLNLHGAAPGLRKLYKLKEDHIKLTPRLRMQVKLATQVLSKTTADALEVQGLHYTKSTIKFVRMFDQVFDCLNVSSINQDRGGKIALAAYRDVNDWRFEFLEKEFLEHYLGRWEEQANDTPNLSQDEKNKLLLSKQTINGWKITVKSFVELTKLLLQSPNVKMILSEKFSQDPLEEHFARQRRSGGTCDNPTLYQFGQHELSLLVMKSELIRDLRGNTRRGNQNQIHLDVNDMRKLPQKRKR